jgi:hypothetical protein
MGTRGVGIMNLTAFSLLANNSPKVDGNQISFRTIDFQPQPPNFTPIFESLDQEMDLTIRSLNFCVRSLGSIRLSDPAKPDPSASKSKTIAMSESSVGSSNEANSSVSFAIAEIVGGKIKELDETMENLDLGDQLEDLMICHDDASDKSTNTWKIGLELHEDDETIFSSFNSKFDNRYQVLTRQLRRIRQKQQSSTQPSKRKQRSKSLSGRRNRRFSGKQGKSLTVSRGVEDNQNNHRTWRAHTNRCKQKHAFRVPLCLKTAIKATSKRKKRNTKKERFSHCSKCSSSQSMQRCIVHEQQKALGSTARIKNGRQQVDTKRRGSISQ